MRPAALVVLAAVLACSGTDVADQSSADLSDRASLAGNSPPWATAANKKAAAAATDWVNLRVYLNWENVGPAQALAAAVSDSKSASYGKFLTPQQFRQQFAPSAQSAQNVQQWLSQQGFNVVYTPLNNHYVAAEGTVAQAQAAFGVALNLYQVQGLTLRAPDRDPSVPAGIAPTVAGIVGLDQAAQLVKTYRANDPDASPTPGFLNPPPCAAYWGESFSSL